MLDLGGNFKGKDSFVYEEVYELCPINKNVRFFWRKLVKNKGDADQQSK